MTRTEAFEEARRRIREAAASQAPLLDLGDLPLETLPDELGKLSALRILALGSAKPELNDGQLAWTYYSDRCSEELCQSLRGIASLAGLSALEQLDLSRREMLADFSALIGLTGLQSLTLSGCASFSNLTAISRLGSLQHLDLSECSNVSNLDPLANLIRLRSLALSGCPGISNLTPLAGLAALQRLELNECCGITDFAPLASLSTLQKLELSECVGISNLSPLAGLIDLTHLDLILCPAIADLTPLARLTNLKSLAFSDCDNIQTLAPLANLANLQSLDFALCDGISDLTPLAALANLMSLDISACWGISDVAPLAGLTNVQRLSLMECEHISDLSPLTGLTNLQTLDLSYCSSVTHFAPIFPLLKNLSLLRLLGCHPHDLPAEVCGRSPLDNDIEAVRAHLADLQGGAGRDPELKVFVLGNGGVGKTQLCRRLNGLPYDATVPTTHGVQLGQVELELAPGVPVRLNLWDFGGQDIYHGSHTLFLQGQAVFLLLWTPGREDGDYREHGLTMRHRPLAYWLDYVRGLAGVNAPLLVIQSQCDSPRDRKAPSFGMPADDFTYLQRMEFSAQTDLGLDLLKAHLKEAVREVFARRPAPPIGLGRLRVRDRLREMLNADQARPAGARQHRTLTLTEFDELCAETGKVSDPRRLLDYLHRQGVVFHRAGVFGDRIVLDQTWALEAIYALFHRENALPFFYRDGRFTRRELGALVWQNHPEEDQELFLELMQGCGICFQIRNRAQPKEEPEWEYLAPELLPEWSAVQTQLLGRLQAGPPGARATVRYRFLHEGILRGFLSELGTKAGDAAIYWRYGCWFWEEQRRSQVLIRSEWSQAVEQPGAGVLTLEAWGEQPAEVLAVLLDVLQSHPVCQAPVIEKTWREEDLRDFGRLKFHGLPVPITGEATPAKPPAEPVTLLEVPARPNLPPAGPREVFISYAWGDDRSDAGRERGEIVERLYAQLRQWGFTVHRDCKEMRSGELISGFMKKIGQGDCVVVILSEKYLRSPYCVTELHYIYERAHGEKAEFLKRIIPVVLADAKFTGWRDRLAHAQHWKGEFEAMEQHFTSLGVEDIRLHHQMRKWHGDIGDMLHFIADKLSPHGFEAIVQDDFKAVREMLDR